MAAPRKNDPVGVLPGNFVLAFNEKDAIRRLLDEGAAPMIMDDFVIVNAPSLNESVTRLLDMGYPPENMLVVYLDARRLSVKSTVTLKD